MNRKSKYTLILAVLMLLAFTTVAIAAPAMVSANKTFKAAGAKVVYKAKVMTITKGKIVIVINAKEITKNKVAVKNVKGKYKLAKNDYLILPTLAKTLLPPATPAAKPAAATPTVSTVPAAPAATVETKPVSAAAGFGLTDDKAKAFDMLLNCKYSGKSKGNIVAKISEIAIIGNVKATLATSSNATRTLCSVSGLPMGNFQDNVVKIIPFIEILDGKDKDIAAFLKNAKEVTVADNVITISKAIPPASLIDIMNSINKDEKWVAEDLELSGKIVVGKTSVETLDSKMVGNSHGTKKPHPVDVTIDFKF